jgi:hypothetical protein
MALTHRSNKAHKNECIVIQNTRPVISEKVVHIATIEL